VRHSGLAESHFRWSQGPLTTIRRQINRWILWGVPLLLLIAVLNARVAFTLLMILLSSGLRVILRSNGGAITEWVNNSGSDWLKKLHGVTSWLVTLVPLVFAALALAGYYYTAVHLLQKLTLGNDDRPDT
jgi:potassium efflux system protein